ncbi:MAG: uroporphyrinogen decarboxylase family protein [Armatimonadia bacterium]
MTKRERVLTAMNRQVPDRVPKEISFTPAVYEKFKQATGADNPAAYFDLDTSYVGFKASGVQVDWSEWYPDGHPEGTGYSEYGGAHIPGEFYHFTRYDFPMKNVRELRRMEEFPWPDFTAPHRHDHLEAQVQKLHDDGWFVSGGVGHIWENAWQVTSMEKLMMDFVEHPDQAAYVLDRITFDREFMARRYAEAGVDSLHCGDDVGMQDRLMMSPQMWREWLKPRWKRVWAAAREIKPDIHIFYHSDGNISEIIPDLIEIGMTILNPVQPECLDPAQMKALYGDQVAFWGCVGTQTTFPFGTPQDMRQTIRHLIQTVGKGGGLLLAPTHVLEPEVPWENIVAFFDAIEEFGYY